MKSGLEGRNKRAVSMVIRIASQSLNEVRPRRPEQTYYREVRQRFYAIRLNEVRPRRPGTNAEFIGWPEAVDIAVSMKSGLEGRNKPGYGTWGFCHAILVSMKSGLEGRNKLQDVGPSGNQDEHVSMKSGLEGRNKRSFRPAIDGSTRCLNEVRPRRPEQTEINRRFNLDIRPSQ